MEGSNCPNQITEPQGGVQHIESSGDMFDTKYNRDIYSVKKGLFKILLGVGRSEWRHYDP